MDYITYEINGTRVSSPVDKFKFNEFFQDEHATFTQLDCRFHGENQSATDNGKCLRCVYSEKVLREEAQYESEIKSTKILANVGERFIDCTLENYPTSTQRHTYIVEKLSSYSYLSGKSLLMLGSCGVGKTTLASAMIDRMVRNKKSCYYELFFNLVRIRDNDYKNFLKQIMKIDFLVIDEFGHGITVPRLELFFEVLDERYRNRRPTLIISNLPLEDDHERGFKGFKSTIDERVYSRLKEGAIFLPFENGDYRLKEIK
jgi:DNA replication protein DnaC